MALELSNRHSRRSLLIGIVGALAGAATATVAGAQAVLAASDDGKPLHVGDHDVDVRSTTSLRNKTTQNTVISAHAYSEGTALYGGSNAGSGVHGYSVSSYGVMGQSHAGMGVYGVGHGGSSGVVGQSDTGHAVTGYADGHGATAVYAQSHTGLGVNAISDSGTAVWASSGSAGAIFADTFSNTVPAIHGWSEGPSTGIHGQSGGATRSKSPLHTGVYGSATGDASAVGVHGSAAAGRGGLFSGGVAQLNLVPSSAATHPASGQAGDLFLDKSSRLWLCKGGTGWVKLA